MSDPNPSEARWASYYRANADRPPRELLRLAVSYFETSDAEARTAIDLGCGAGNETAALLKLGWRVLAIDNQPEAFARLQARISPEESARLETQQASFEQMRLPQTDLIWAGLSLPFCRPEHFDTVWAAVVDAIRPGGLFAGDFFGNRHVWAGNPDMTSHTLEQVRARFASLKIEYFLEEEGTRRTTLQGLQHWHGISVVARKP